MNRWTHVSFHQLAHASRWTFQRDSGKRNVVNSSVYLKKKQERWPLHKCSMSVCITCTSEYRYVPSLDVTLWFHQAHFSDFSLGVQPQHQSFWFWFLFASYPPAAAEISHFSDLQQHVQSNLRNKCIVSNCKNNNAVVSVAEGGEKCIDDGHRCNRRG